MAKHRLKPRLKDKPEEKDQPIGEASMEEKDQGNVEKTVAFRCPAHLLEALDRWAAREMPKAAPWQSPVEKIDRSKAIRFLLWKTFTGGKADSKDIARAASKDVDIE
jgi:hypothetical protein